MNRVLMLVFQKIRIWFKDPLNLAMVCIIAYFVINTPMSLPKYKLTYPWLNILLGPFSFLRCGEWFHGLWRGFLIFVLFLLGISLVNRGLIGRVFMMMVVFSWCAMGASSILIYMTFPLGYKGEILSIRKEYNGIKMILSGWGYYMKNGHFKETKGAVHKTNSAPRSKIDSKVVVSNMVYDCSSAETSNQIVDKVQ